MRFEVITLSGKVYESGDITSAVLPTLAGEITVLPNHMPLFSLLKDGKIKVIKKENNQEIADNLKISGGFAEIQPQLITVMADNFENLID